MNPFDAFALGVALVMVPGVFLVHAVFKHTFKSAFLDGAKHMLEVVQGQQEYVYKELEKEPGTAGMLYTVDAMSTGARVAYDQLFKEMTK